MEGIFRLKGSHLTGLAIAVPMPRPYIFVPFADLNLTCRVDGTREMEDAQILIFIRHKQCQPWTKAESGLFIFFSL